MSRQLRPNSYENFFAQPFWYNDSYGIAIAANSQEDALNKYMAYFDEWHWITKDNRKYMLASLRENMQNAWVRWQGYTDDDGEFHNGWVITTEYHGGQKYWRHVYISDYEKHYVEHGHRYQAEVDDYGRKASYNCCTICGYRP